jgi:hypothetical protein
MTNLTNNNIMQSIVNITRPDFVSDNYAFIPTMPIVESIEARGWQVVDARAAKKRQGNTQFGNHQLTFRSPEYVSDGDSVPQLILRNSHDRSTALEFHLGFFRFACSNGIIVGESLLGSFKVYHSGNIQEKVASTIDKILTQAPEVIKTRDTMKARKMDYFDAVTLAEDCLQDIQAIRKLQVDPSKLLGIQRNEDTLGDLWTYFNIIQENALGALTGIRTTTNKETGQVQRKVVGARKVKSLDIDTRLNKALFDRALRYL